MRNVQLGVSLVVSFAGLACSPAADPIGKGSAAYSVSQVKDPSVEGGACGVTTTAGLFSDEARVKDGNVGAPDLASSGIQEPTQVNIDNFGGEVIDGEAGPDGSGKYTVECSVTKKGDEYRVVVEMSGRNTHPLVVTENSGTTKLTVDGSINATTGIGSGRVVVQTTMTRAVSPKSGFECSLIAVTEETDLESFQIARGEARFVFECAAATTPLDDFAVCSTRGTVSVRDCLKS